MLQRFRVSNFSSFNETQEFTMVAGKPRLKMDHLFIDRGVNILRFSAIYGANAAGKSNLVKAMQYARKCIILGLDTRSENKYCRISEENKTKPTIFEFNIKINTKYYSYGIALSLSRGILLEEWLFDVAVNENEESILLYAREYNETENKYTSTFDKSFGDAAINRLEDDAESLNRKVTLLSLYSADKNQLFKKYTSLSPLYAVNNWFSDTLNIVTPKTSLIESSPDKTQKNRIVRLLKYEELDEFIKVLGLGINGTKLVPISEKERAQVISDAELEDTLTAICDNYCLSFSKILKNCTAPDETSPIQHEYVASNKREYYPNQTKTPVRFLIHNENGLLLYTEKEDGKNTCEKIMVSHGRNNTWFDITEESDGTQRIIDLIEILCAAKYGADKVYIIDEVDRSLHPDLTRNLVETYLGSLERNSETQLIVTTHEARIMDLSLLRQDEIWFIDKKASGSSELYSLEQYDERYDRKVDKAYFEGRYGAIPRFNVYFPLPKPEENELQEPDI